MRQSPKNKRFPLPNYTLLQSVLFHVSLACELVLTLVQNVLPNSILVPPTANAPPMLVRRLSRTHGYVCTFLKSSTLTVFAASARLKFCGLLPAEFCPKPSGSPFAVDVPSKTS